MNVCWREVDGGTEDSERTSGGIETGNMGWSEKAEGGTENLESSSGGTESGKRGWKEPRGGRGAEGWERISGGIVIGNVGKIEEVG